MQSEQQVSPTRVHTPVFTRSLKLTRTNPANFQRHPQMFLGETVRNMVFNNCSCVCQLFLQSIPRSNVPIASPSYEFSCLTLNISTLSLTVVAVVLSHHLLWIARPKYQQYVSKVFSINRYLNVQ